MATRRGFLSRMFAGAAAAATPTVPALTDEELAARRTLIVGNTGAIKVLPHVAAGSALTRRPTTGNPNPSPPRAGMWVVFGGQTVGILTALEPGDIATVDVVSFPQGLTLKTIHCLASQLRQAWYEEIPLARRPDIERATAQGYHPKPV